MPTKPRTSTATTATTTTTDDDNNNKRPSPPIPTASHLSTDTEYSSLLSSGPAKNPLLEDEQLQALLKQVDAIDNPKQFLLWRLSFLKRYNEFLDQESTVRAERVYKKFRKAALQPLILYLQRLRTHLLKNEITGRKCTVKARHTLGNLQHIVVQVTTQLSKLLPTTGEEQMNVGYSKFHMGALLLRDGFTEYARLTLAEEIFRHLKSNAALQKHADTIFWRELEHYCTALNIFIGILADLGLKMPLDKSRELMNEDEEEDVMTVVDDGGGGSRKSGGSNNLDDSTTTHYESVTNFEVSFVMSNSSHHSTNTPPNNVVQEEEEEEEQGVVEASESEPSLSEEDVDDEPQEELGALMVMPPNEIVEVPIVPRVVTPEVVENEVEDVDDEEESLHNSSSHHKSLSSSYYHNSSSDPQSWRIADQIRQEQDPNSPVKKAKPKAKAKITSTTPAVLLLEGDEEQPTAKDRQVVVSAAPKMEVMIVNNELVVVDHTTAGEKVPIESEPSPTKATKSTKPKSSSSKAAPVPKSPAKKSKKKSTPTPETEPPPPSSYPSPHVTKEKVVRPVDTSSDSTPPAPQLDKKSKTKKKAQPAGKGEDSTVTTREESTVAEPYPSPHTVKERVVRPAKASAKESESQEPYPAPHITKEEVARRPKASKTDAVEEAEPYPSPHTTREKVARPPKQAKETVAPDSSYPKAHTTKEKVKRDKKPPATSDGPKPEKEPTPARNVKSRAPSQPREPSQHDDGGDDDDADEAAMDHNSSHSAARSKKPFWFFRKPKPAKTESEMDRSQAVDSTPALDASHHSSVRDDGNDEPEKKSASFWPFKKRAEDAENEPAPATERPEKSELPPMFSFRKKPADNDAPPKEDNEATPSEEKASRFSSLLRKPKGADPKESQENPPAKTTAEPVQPPARVEDRDDVEKDQPAKKDKPGIFSMLRKRNDQPDSGSTDEQAYPQAHTTKEVFVRPKDEVKQAAPANDTAPVASASIEKPKPTSESPSRLSSARKVVNDEPQQPYPEAHTKREKVERPVDGPQRPTESSKSVDKASPKEPEAPKAETAASDKPGLFSRLRKGNNEDGTNDAAPAPAPKREESNVAARTSDQAKKSVQAPPEHSKTSKAKVPEEPKDESSTKEKPGLLSMFRKNKADASSPSDDANSDERQPYPPAHKTREEVSRPKQEIDAQSEAKNAKCTPPPDVPQEPAKTSEKEAPSLFSFLKKKKDDGAPPSEVPSPEEKLPYPEAHTTKETVVRPKPSAAAPAVTPEQAPAEPAAASSNDETPATNDKSKAKPSLFSFRKSKADEAETPTPDSNARQAREAPQPAAPVESAAAKQPDNGTSKRSFWPFQGKKDSETNSAVAGAPEDDENQPYPPLHSRTAKQSLDRPQPSTGDDEALPYPDLHEPTARDSIDRPVPAVPYPELQKEYASETPGHLPKPSDARGGGSSNGLLQITNGEDEEEDEDGAPIEQAPSSALLQLTNGEEYVEDADAGAAEVVDVEPADASTPPPEPTKKKKKSKKSKKKEKADEEASSPSSPPPPVAEVELMVSAPPEVVEIPAVVEVPVPDEVAVPEPVTTDPDPVPEVLPETEPEPEPEPVVRPPSPPPPVAAAPEPPAPPPPPAAVETVPEKAPPSPPSPPKPRPVVRAPPPPPPPSPPTPPPPPPPPPQKIVLTEERKKKCYMWYARLGQPNRDTMKRKVLALPDSCDITVQEVDALPWVGGGMCLSVKAMNELFLNPEDA